MSTTDIVVRYTGKFQTSTIRGMTGYSAKSAKAAAASLGRQLHGKSFAHAQQIYLQNSSYATVWRMHTKRLEMLT